MMQAAADQGGGWTVEKKIGMTHTLIYTSRPVPLTSIKVTAFDTETGY